MNKIDLILIFVIIVILLVYWQYSYKKVSYKKRKILIITAENRKADFINYHDINFKNYCDKHNYDYIRFDDCPERESSIYWCKMHKIKKALTDKTYDYIMWCDSDTIITKMDESLDYYISMSGEKDIIIGTDYIYQIKGVLNAGVFIIKNSKVGRDFIDDCLADLQEKPGCIRNGKEQGEWAKECYEQGAINKLIKTDEYKNNVFIDDRQKFILTILPEMDVFYSILNPTFITHLASHSEEYRNAYFKKYI